MCWRVAEPRSVARTTRMGALSCVLIAVMSASIPTGRSVRQRLDLFDEEANAHEEPIIIELSNQEHKILEAQAHRYTLPYPDVVRAKIALMAAEGLDHHKIAAHLDTRREAVSKWPR